MSGRYDWIDDYLEPGERLIDAAGAIVSRRGRRRRRDVPRGAFILARTDRRLVAFAATPWRLRPGAPITAWSYDDGAALRAAPFGRARLVLPDRTVVTLSAFGGWSLSRLTRHA